MKGAGGLLPLIVVVFTGCATFKDIAFPAPSAPPARSIAVVASLPPALPPPSPPSVTTVPSSPARRPATAAPAVPPRVVVPPPPPRPTPPPSSPPPPAAPPRVLSAGVEDEQRMQREAQTRIEGAERLIKDIDPKKLSGPREEEDLQTIQSFLSDARKALSAQDVQRAFVLADKALLLANELSRALSPR